MFSNKPADVFAWKYENADDVSAPFTGAKRTLIDLRAIADPLAFKPFSPFAVMPEMTDIWFSALVPAGTGAVGADFEIVLVDNV